MSVWAVIAAAGEGERLGLDRPKAFAPLGSRVLLAESVERLEWSDWVDAIVVAVPAGWEEPAILLAEELGCGKVVSVVAGGDTRAGQAVDESGVSLPRRALGRTGDAPAEDQDFARPFSRARRQGRCGEGPSRRPPRDTPES